MQAISKQPMVCYARGWGMVFCRLHLMVRYSYVAVQMCTNVQVTGSRCIHTHSNPSTPLRMGARQQVGSSMVHTMEVS
jgi:hypothetical protein